MYLGVGTQSESKKINYFRCAFIVANLVKSFQLNKIN